MKKSTNDSSAYLACYSRNGRAHKWLAKLFYSLLLVALHTTLWAQVAPTTTAKVKITGKVLSDDGDKPLERVSVTIKGSNFGTVTDIKGDFTIYAYPKDILVFSFVNYTTRETIVGNKTRIDVKLEEDASKLVDVVVVSDVYDKNKTAKSNTDARSKMNAEQITATQSTTIDQAMQGQMAGVVVQQVSGQPGGAVSVQIRGLATIGGSAEPMYIIDGVIIPPNEPSALEGSNTNPLSSINPNEIASIEVLKDASATAIYGSQATNGVVLITTKRGNIAPPKITYDYYWGTQNLPKYYPLMNLREYAEFMNERVNGGNTGSGTGVSFPQFNNPKYLGDGTNWQKVIFIGGITQNHVVGVSGGDVRTQYALSGGYFHQTGIARGSDFNRYTFKVNLDNKTNNFLKIGTSLNLSNVTEKTTTSDANAISIALQQTPDVALYNTDGSWGMPDRNPYGYAMINPVAVLISRKDDRNNYRLFGNFYATIDFNKHLSLRNEFAPNIELASEDKFQPSYNFGGAFVNNQSTTSYRSAQSFSYTIRNFFTYKRKWPELDLVAIAGHEAHAGSSSIVAASRRFTPSNDVQVISSGDVTTATNSGTKNQYAQEAYFLRSNFGILNQKVYLTGNLRLDGSSRFASWNRWVLTSSGAVAWRLTDEKFIKRIHEINDLKARLSYGITNNQNIPNYVYGSTLNVNLSALTGRSVLQTNIPNPDVTWEKTKTLNLGIDGIFFKRRLEVSLDLYTKTTNDLLLNLSMPLYAGTVLAGSSSIGALTSPYRNVGSLNNKGIELNVTVYNIKNKVFQWKTTYVISHNRNKVLSLNTPTAAFFGSANSSAGINVGGVPQNIAKTAVGSRIAEFWGYETDGLFTKAADFKNRALPVNSLGIPLPIQQNGVWIGDVIFRDKNKDGIINENDQTYLGSPFPIIQYGINNNIKYKNFDVTIFFAGNIGNKIFNQLRLRAENPNDNASGYFKTVLNFPRVARIDTNGKYTDIENVYMVNAGTKIQRISQDQSNGNTRFSDRYIEDGTFLRCKSILIAYTLPANLLKRVFLNRMRIYFNVTNVFTITNYSGFDPEVGSRGTLVSGVDAGRYPINRTYTVGVNLALNQKN
jgi:TonB-dependent starch-binding outer membrane protein SusC